MRRVSVVMNARLQSSRLERKLVRPFADTTLIDIAVAKLAQLDFFEHRFLATAEPELAERGRRYPGIEILERNAEAVARGPHPTLVTFQHYLRVPTPWVFVVNPCSAFLSVETIRSAFETVRGGTDASYISVVPTRDWIFAGDGAPLTHRDPKALQNTSSGAVHYKASQAFYAFDRVRFEREQGLLWALTPGDPQLLPMPIEESHDVDTLLEFEFAAFLWARRTTAS